MWTFRSRRYRHVNPIFNWRTRIICNFLAVHFCHIFGDLCCENNGGYSLGQGVCASWKENRQGRPSSFWCRLKGISLRLFHPISVHSGNASLPPSPPRPSPVLVFVLWVSLVSNWLLKLVRGVLEAHFCNIEKCVAFFTFMFAWRECNI